MAFKIERGGFETATTLIASLVSDLVANGFDLKFPITFNPSTVTSPYKVMIEASGTVDPLNAASVTEKQPWRIMFEVQDDFTCFIYVGTPTTLPDNGNIPYYIEKWIRYQLIGADIKLRVTDVVGNIHEKMSKTTYPLILGPSIPERGPYMSDDYNGIWIPKLPAVEIFSTYAQIDEPQYGFINRRFRMAVTPGSSYPMRYRIVTTDHGVWFGKWEDTDSSSAAHDVNWVLIQRPVDSKTGEVLTTGKAPVWCLSYNSANGHKPNVNFLYQTVVRESDVLKPSNHDMRLAPVDGTHRRADIDQDRSNALINMENQVSLAENGNCIIRFPTDLNTNRFYYKCDLDMLGYASADLISQGTSITIPVYGEETSRNYLAMQATKNDNSGVRFLVIDPEI